MVYTLSKSFSVFDSVFGSGRVPVYNIYKPYEEMKVEHIGETSGVIQPHAIAASTHQACNIVQESALCLKYS